MMVQAAASKIRFVVYAALCQRLDVIPFVDGDRVSLSTRFDFTELRAVNADGILLKQTTIARLECATSQSLRAVNFSRSRDPITS
jgi:hypothetical protein